MGHRGHPFGSLLAINVIQPIYSKGGWICEDLRYNCGNKVLIVGDESFRFIYVSTAYVGI
jgi:hypothetical protein